MNYRFKESLIRKLTTELDIAMETTAEKIAAEIKNIGFSCLMCGRCCRREHGDNSVIVSPAEIENICRYTGLEHMSVAQPPHEISRDFRERRAVEELSDMIDIQGNIHTFGWELTRNKNGDCIFIQDIAAGNKCSIHPARPMLCSTYPFHIEEGELRVSECEGLGKEMGTDESLELARKVIMRYREELKETILLYENYESFRSGPENINKAIENIREGIITYVVHDSTGSHRTTRRIS
jgi:hypothetical protein